MLLTITSTATNASDLGFLLHKHPERVQRFDVGVGRAHVFYPEANDERCTAALLLEVDPVGLVRDKRFRMDGFSLAQYVNDRPYAASSLLAVALGRVFKTALTGRCDARPELASAALPLQIVVPALPCSGGPELARGLFEPLGWTVEATTVPLDPALPDWGDSRYLELRLTGSQRLADALGHLYVLLPVLDGAKHYWVGPDEVDKLVRNAGGWLATHPERELITRRYLAHQRSFVDDATARLSELDDLVDADEDPPRRAPLAAERRTAVVDELRRCGAARVADLGCGEGALLAELLKDPSFTQVIGTDVSDRALRKAERRFAPDRLSDSQRERLTLWQSSLMYRDQRLRGLDAAVLMEVVEHIDADRLSTMEQAVFGAAHPSTVIVTTPNAEYNVRYPALADGGHRHRDHRFEFGRAGFTSWARKVADRFGYGVRIRGVGEDDSDVGAPTQMAVFREVVS